MIFIYYATVKDFNQVDLNLWISTIQISNQIFDETLANKKVTVVINLPSTEK